MIWEIESNSQKDNEIIEALQQVKSYQTLIPAVITNVAEQSANIKLFDIDNNNHYTIKNINSVKNVFLKFCHVSFLRFL